MKFNRMKSFVCMTVMMVMLISFYSVKVLASYEMFFDYKSYISTNFGNDKPSFDKWGNLPAGYSGANGAFVDINGTTYNGVGMPGPHGGFYSIEYNIPQYATQFSTNVFIDRYYKDATGGSVTYEILVDNRSVATLTQNSASAATLMTANIPSGASTLTLKLTTTTFSFKGSNNYTFDVIWGNPTFTHTHVTSEDVFRVEKAPTCTSEGTKVLTCTICGEDVKTETMPMLPHTPSGNWVVTKEATCTEAGEEVQYCSVCGEVALTQVIPKLAHTPTGDWVVTKQPTCTDEGERVQYCSVCGEVAMTQVMPKLPHTPSGTWVVVKDPLCNEAGRRVQYCTVCGEEALSEVIPPLTNKDHVFVEHVVSGNIFIPPIVTEKVCSICGYTEQTTDWHYVWVSPAILAAILISIITVFKVRKGARKKKTFVCPYCFETHLVHEVEFRCANVGCSNVDDVPLTKYEGGNPSMPLKAKPTFSAPKSKNYSIPKHANCPTCNRESSKLICPSCHNSLPDSSLRGEDMIISVVGSRDVGKSHFIGVIINELIERVAGKFDGALTGFDDTMTRYEENFGRRLYVELTKLDLTRSSTVNKNNGAYRPLIFTLSIRKGKKIKNYTLVFFDTAGEDLNEFDTMNTVNRYICKSAGIIFLLDPMQIWSVRNQLDDEVVSRASSVAVQQATRPDDIMTRVSRLIRSDKKMEQSKKINIPVAAVFSKFDVLIPIIPKGCTVLEPSPHCNEGEFVMADWHNVNSEIQSLLKTWGASAFTQQLEINYTNFSYFAVSSLGLDNSPRKDSHIDRPRPHRIEDALLWILKENGVIKEKK